AQQRPCQLFGGPHRPTERPELRTGPSGFAIRATQCHGRSVPGPGRRLEIKKKQVDSRKFLLEHAIENFTKFGSKRFSMDELAQSLGISKKTIYKQFGSK